MKLDFNKKNTTIAVYAFLVIAAAMLFYVLVSNIRTVFGYVGAFLALIAPFIYGFCIAYLLNPIMKQTDKWFAFVEHKKPNFKLRRGLSVLTTYIICVIILGLFVWIVSNQISASFALFIDRLKIWVPDMIRNVTAFINSNENFKAFEGQINKMLEYVGGIAWRFSENSISRLFGGIINVTSGIVDFILAIIISIYMLCDKERFIRNIKKLLTVLFKENKKNAIVNVSADVNSIFSRFIIGKIIDSAIVGVLCALIMTIFRMPFAALVGFIVGITNIIPYFGAIFGGVIGALIILVANPVQALWFAVLIFVLQQIDGNIIGPRILGESIGISAFWVIFAILIGGGLFGIVGMIVGVPIFAFIHAFIKSLVNRKINQETEEI